MKDIIDGNKTKNVRGDRAKELLEHISALFTKEEVIAILTEIQLEIEGLDLEDVVPEFQDGAECTREYIANMIEEKINSLKEDT